MLLAPPPLWKATPAVPAPLDGLSGVTGAWSASRKLLSSYNGPFTQVVSTALRLKAQSGQDFDGLAASFSEVAAGPNSRNSIYIVSVGGGMTAGPLMSSYISGSAGYVIVSGLIETYTSNLNTASDDALIRSNSNGIAVHLRSTGPGIRSFNRDSGGEDNVEVAGPPVGVPFVFEWRHEGGTLYARLNGGTEASVASGDTFSLGTSFKIGENNPDLKIFEVVTCNPVPPLGERDAVVADFKNWIGA